MRCTPRTRGSRSRRHRPTEGGPLRPQGSSRSSTMTARAPQGSVAVLGAGSWGTALAIQLARAGRAVRLWGRDGARLAAMARARRNERYLPSAPFPDGLEVEADLPAALAAARDVLIVVPSPAFRSVLGAL